MAQDFKDGGLNASEAAEMFKDFAQVQKPSERRAAAAVPAF